MDLRQSQTLWSEQQRQESKVARGRQDEERKREHLVAQNSKTARYDHMDFSEEKQTKEE
jgi:hypothetical protein